MRSLWFAAIAALLVGCVSHGPDINQRIIDGIEPGATHISSLQGQLGEPIAKTRRSDGTQLISWGSARSGILGSGMTSTGLTVVVDPSGTVTDYTTTQQNLLK